MPATAAAHALTICGAFAESCNPNQGSSDPWSESERRVGCADPTLPHIISRGDLFTAAGMNGGSIAAKRQRTGYQTWQIAALCTW